MTELRWTDNHCHLDPSFTDGDGPRAADDAIDDARAAGVLRLIDVGTDYETSAAAVEVAAAHPGTVWATVGIHPHDARLAVERGDDAYAPLEQELARDEVVAVGECGLDYHYDHSPRDQQRQVFADQIALAHATGKTLVIHSREAWDDTFAILGSEGVPERTVFHCFTGGADEARIALDLGTHLSFSGIVTFPSAQDLRDAAELCPLDRLLVETDAPYLAPVPHRGKRNRPALVTVVGAAVAATKGLAVEEVAVATWDNATALYQLPG
jgi:TatD DNase family protein